MTSEQEKAIISAHYRAMQKKSVQKIKATRPDHYRKMNEKRWKKKTSAFKSLD